MAQRAAIAQSKSKHVKGTPAGKAAMITKGGVKYIEREDALFEEVDQPKPRKARTSRPRMKHDTKDVKAARELRDRYLEEVNASGSALLLPPAAHGWHDVSRQLGTAPMQQTNLLDAA